MAAAAERARTGPGDVETARHQRRSVAWPWTRSRRRTPGTRARRWRSRRSRTCSGHADHALRRAATRLARPRPVRALVRARVDAAVLDALPHRVRARARGHRAVPPVGIDAPPATPSTGTRAGIEVTTGPLGQGIANAVGLALAEANLRARFGPSVTDHHVFTICSDGDLEEGVSHEAASLAGHLGLGRLVAVYDDNHITIDGPTELALTDDVPAALPRRTAGTSSSSARSRTTSTRSSAASARRMAEADRRASSCCAATSVGRRRSTPTRRRPTASAARRGRGPRGQGDPRPAARRALLGARRRARVLPRRRRPRPRGARGVGAATAPRCARPSPALADDYDACIAGNAASRAGRRSSRPGRRASRSRPARPARRRSTRSPTSCPVSSAAAPTSPATPGRSCSRTPA